MPKALVLGGDTGLLGQALMRVLNQEGWTAESLGRKDGNLMDMAFLKNRVENAGADVIFNTIAWTRVDDAEDYPEDALEMNRTFPDALAHIVASLNKGHLAHYSTDFVFSGKTPVAHTETDTPDPVSVYGKTKLAGENAVLHILPQRSCVLRTAWLFGPGKKNFITTILDACARKKTLKIVDDQIGSPTYTLDLAAWSLALASRKATGIWNTVNSGRASWCELASEAVALASAPCGIHPIPSSQWPQKAERPKFSVLDNSKLANFLGKKPRPWPQALRNYLFGEYSALNKENKE